jgi:phenylalanyl-tRNA synthetase beta subunit
LTPSPINAEIDKMEQNEEYELLAALKKMLVNNYYNEVKTYNLTSEARLNEFNIFKLSQFIKIENAHNSARAFLRSNLIDALLSVLSFNNSYKTQLQPIFEIQNIYTQGATNLNLTLLNEENIDIDHINHSRIVMNLIGLKSLANSVASIFNSKFDYFVTKDIGFFYANEVLAIHCNGKLIGYMGNMKASKLKEFDLHTRNIYCLTLNLNILFDLYHPNTYRFHSVSNLMPIFKDISFFIQDSSKITNALDGLNALSFIHQYEFIDRYIDENGRISYTIRFRFENATGLDTKAIDGYIKGIEQVLIESNCEMRSKP